MTVCLCSIFIFKFLYFCLVYFSPDKLFNLLFNFSTVFTTFKPAKSFFVILLSINILPHISPIAWSDTKNIDKDFYEHEWTVYSTPSKVVK